MTTKEQDKLREAIRTTPKRLKVGPWPYRIFVQKDNIKIADDPVLKRGTCHPQRTYIRLSTEEIFSAEAYVGLLLHELLHAIWDNQNIGDKPKEEEAVIGLHFGLTGLFVDNPKLLDWIKKGVS